MSLLTSANKNHEGPNYLPGELVEVRSWSEISATLDESGMHEHLPFMPEMLAFCGRQFRISRQAFKTCIDDNNMRELRHTVFLENVRCDGQSHGDCDRACLIFWKAAWLKPVRTSAESNVSRKANLTESALKLLAQKNGEFICQSSEILNASTRLPWWRGRQYVWDLTRNRVSLLDWLRSLSIAVYNKVAQIGDFNSWRAVHGNGSNPAAETLNLRPGELVRVKSLSQIKKTLDAAGKNQNLLFAPTMIQFCGRVLRVRNRVNNIILEGTRRQRKLKGTVILEEAVCDGICHRMCSRQSFLFWRECWLERVSN